MTPAERREISNIVGRHIRDALATGDLATELALLQCIDLWLRLLGHPAFHERTPPTMRLGPDDLARIAKEALQPAPEPPRPDAA